MTNRFVFFFVACLLFAACSGSRPALATTPKPFAAPQTDAALRASVDRLAAAWEAGNADAWAAEYWDDGTLVNILGVVFPNSLAVERVTNAILAGPFHGSSLVAFVRDVRLLGDAAAIVDCDVSVTNFRALPPGAVATSPNLLLTRFTFVFEKRAGIWKIEASQNTAVPPTPSLSQATR